MPLHTPKNKQPQKLFKYAIIRHDPTRAVVVLVIVVIVVVVATSIKMMDEFLVYVYVTVCVSVEYNIFENCKAIYYKDFDSHAAQRKPLFINNLADANIVL